MSERIEGLVSENDVLRDESSSLSERIEGLVSEKNSLLEESLLKSNKNEKLLFENQKLLKENFEKDSIIYSLNENLSSISSSLNKKDNQIDFLNSELDKTKQDLLFKTDKLKNFSSEVNFLNKRNKELTKTKQNQFNEIVSLKSSNEGLNELVDGLTNEIVNKNNIILEKEKSFNNLVAELNQFKERYSMANGELNKSLKDFKLVKERNDTLTKTKKDQFDEIIRLKSLNDYLMDNINNLKNHNVNLNNLLVVSVNDYDELNKLLQDSIHSRYVLEQENYYLKNSNYSLKVQLDKLLKSNSWKMTAIFRKIKNFIK